VVAHEAEKRDHRTVRPRAIVCRSGERVELERLAADGEERDHLLSITGAGASG
jgi:hypothetical protein